jgi:hypothetical protein|nr:MAG TPA: hypothetical protein [Caudoviricetes sp.]
MKLKKLDAKREDNCKHAYIGTVYGLGNGPSYVSKCRKTRGLASLDLCFRCKDFVHKDIQEPRKETGNDNY